MYYSAKPFLKASVLDSVLIDITNVADRLLFLKEFLIAYSGPEYLWYIKDVIHRDYHKHFAEILVSFQCEEKICFIGIRLPSFDQPFVGYPSLSPDSDILKITLNKLPEQYDRGVIELHELQHDMHINHSKFGKIIDCGIVRGISGMYTGRLYAVLELRKLEDQDVSDCPSLSHAVP